MEGFYSTLGLERRASDADVRSAYRRQALITHPDKGGSAIAFRRIVQAFETLGDSVRRATYDRHLVATGGTDGFQLNSVTSVNAGPCTQSQSSGQSSAMPTYPHKFDNAGRHAAAESTTCIPTRKEGPSGEQGKDPKKKRVAEAQDSRHRGEANVGHRASQAHGSTEFAAPTGMQAAPTSESACSGCDDPSALCEELLGHKRDTWDARLSSMTAEILEKLRTYLLHDLKRHGSTKQRCKPVVEAKSEMGSETEKMDAGPSNRSGAEVKAICDTVAASESSDSDAHDGHSSGAGPPGILYICDAPEEDEPCVTPPNSGTSTTNVKSGLTRGVIRSKRRSGKYDYHAVVGFEAMVVQSRSVSRLEDAIDMHISLVRLRQLVRAGLETGQDFPTVLRSAVSQIVAEQLHSGMDLRLAFATRQFSIKPGKGRSDLYAPRTRNVETAISFWEKMKTLGNRVAEDTWQVVSQSMAVRVKQEREHEKEQKQLRKAQQHQMRKAQLKEQAEARRAMREHEKQLRQQRLAAERQERKHLAFERQEKLAEERQALNQKKALFACVKAVLKRLGRPQPTLLHRWGVQRLPPGLELASLHDDNDSLCAVFCLGSGEVARGPLRSTLADAKQDLLDLTHLRDSRGDAVVCEELKRRDVQVMTSHFMATVASPGSEF